MIEEKFASRLQGGSLVDVEENGGDPEMAEGRVVHTGCTGNAERTLVRKDRFQEFDSVARR